jgi:hypothetical protein
MTHSDQAINDNFAAQHEQQANLTFIIPQDTVPYFESAELTGGTPKVFFDTEQRDVTLNDMRAVASELSLDSTGFELRHEPTAVTDLYDDEAIAGPYTDELKALLQGLTGADEVVVFDFTRRSDGGAGAVNPDGIRGPADRVHVDYTVKSGPVRARDALGAERFDSVIAAGGRVMQVNVWRPIKGPVLRAPLALADATSITAKELVKTEQRFSGRVGEIYSIAFSASQRWYWAPQMERDEVILIKGWDSIDDGRARFTPHGAFSLPDSSHAAPRESIEARTFLLFEPARSVAK